MNKDVIYNGYSAVPSDYECPDGDLAMSLNLISEDGHIKPLGLPKIMLSLQNGEKVLLTHNVSGRTNYILARDIDDGNLVEIFWLKKEDNSTSVADTSEATYIVTVNGLLDVAAIGNTLVVASNEGMQYILWKDNGYIPLGEKPPFVSIDFGMYKIGTLNSSEDYTISGRCSPSYSYSEAATKSQLAELTQLAYGLLLPKLADVVTSKGYFYQPFFIRYAFKLYDGSYSWHSVPILMLPTILPPIIKYSDDDSHPGPDSTIKATFSLYVPYFGLSYRILNDDINQLSNWSDIVSGIDVFISAPIYTYDQSKDLEYKPVTSQRGILARVSPEVNEEEVFIGHYANFINDPYIDHYMKSGNVDNPDYISQMLAIIPHENFHKNVQDVNTFYKLAEFDIKDIKTMTDMEQLVFPDTDLSNLVTRTTLPDDYQSHCKVIPSSLYVFNSRLNLSGVKIAPAQPLPIRASMQFGNPEGEVLINPCIKVWSRINGIKCCATYYGSVTGTDSWFAPKANFPRYIYYPDASAYKMEFCYVGESDENITINLSRHDFLNGAFYYLGKEGMRKNPLPPSNAEPETAQCAQSVNLMSKIYTSEINNPFLFPALGINTVGSGYIYDICSAAKALSQGQFGQFPLYAFTSEGVWALETTATGSYSAKQPITRDVCVNPESITQIDSSVLFASDRGIMLLSGSQTQCISDTLNTDFPFDVLSLNGMDKLNEMLGIDDSSCLALAPFSTFLKSCSMIYDYSHQHIIVFSPQYSYAYVYSLKSQHWGLMFSNINTAVNSYPEALAIDKNNKLVDFSSVPFVSDSGLLVSRPLKLDGANVHKTIDNIIQRGNFAKGHVKSVLYGSRDLIHWHLVWSSKDHYLRGFRGTPYKYFRIALLCDLAPGESIYGASVQFNPRLTNQPR